MNVEKWSTFYNLKTHETITTYKGLPSIERFMGEMRHTIVYPTPMVTEVNEKLSVCTILHASHEIFDGSKKTLHCEERLEMDLDFKTYSYYCNLDVKHFDDERAIEFEYSIGIKTQRPTKEIHSALLQQVYELLWSQLMTYSPYRLDLITNQYETLLPEGVVNVTC